MNLVNLNNLWFLAAISLSLVSPPLLSFAHAGSTCEFNLRDVSSALVLFNSNQGNPNGFSLELRVSDRASAIIDHSTPPLRLSNDEAWAFLRNILTRPEIETKFAYYSRGSTGLTFFRRFSLSEFAYEHHRAFKGRMPSHLSPEETLRLFRAFTLEIGQAYPALMPARWIEASFPENLHDPAVAMNLVEVAFRQSLRSTTPPANAFELILNAAGLPVTAAPILRDSLSVDEKRNLFLALTDLVQTLDSRPFETLKFKDDAWKGKPLKRMVRIVRLLRNIYAFRGSLTKLHDPMTQPQAFDDDWDNILNSAGLLTPGKPIGAADLVGLEQTLTEIMEAAALRALEEELDQKTLQKTKDVLGFHFQNAANLVAQLMTDYNLQFVAEDLARTLSQMTEGTFFNYKFLSSEAQEQIGFLSSSQQQAWIRDRAWSELTVLSGKPYLLFIFNLKGPGLLRIGNLTGRPTCLDPATGDNAFSAVAYAMDAHTQAAAGFAVPLDDGVARVIDHELKQGATVKIDELNWTYAVSGSGKVIAEGRIPEYAVLRRVVRVGRTPALAVGLSVENLYANEQHIAKPRLETALARFFARWSHDLGMLRPNPVRIRRSRLHQGTYSDSAHGVQAGEFDMPCMDDAPEQTRTTHQVSESGQRQK